jgi:hypothetical protein
LVEEICNNVCGQPSEIREKIQEIETNCSRPIFSRPEVAELMDKNDTERNFSVKERGPTDARATGSEARETGINHEGKGEGV